VARAAGGAALFLLLAAPPALPQAAGPEAAADAVYPESIAPPPGTQYPCALTPLPRSLPGIPEADRAYVNRTYARLLRATQAKLLVLRAFEDLRDLRAAHARYQDRTERLAGGLEAEAPPAGLEPFHADVREALSLQRRFFARGLALREAGQGMSDVYALPEARQASRRLLSAWGRMRARYPAWTPETKDSIYHHLCALDLF